MKNIIALLFSALFVLQLQAQKDTLIFFNEFSGSVNQTVLNNDNNSESRLGFGFGAYLSGKSDKMFNLVVGFEYNGTKQFRKSVYGGRFSNSTDVTYSIRSISVPVLLRLNIGNNIKFFFETGIFLDIISGARKKGTNYIYIFDQNWHYAIKKSSFNEGAKIGSYNVGPSCGIGLKFPVSKHELIIKADYKLGILSWDQVYDNPLTSRYMRLQLGYRI